MGEWSKIEFNKEYVVETLKLWVCDERVCDYAEDIWQEFLLDVQAIADKDPSQNKSEKVLSNVSKSLLATLWYRMAHYVSINNVCKDSAQVARKMSEYIASVTSIDIHPSCSIGSGLFIDHGANIVIGATADIGNNFCVFHNVILGSKKVNNNQDKKRHPTIGDNVVICGGARVLGDIHIGDNVFISPNAVVLDDIPSDSKVTIVNQLQISSRESKNRLSSQKLVVYGMQPKYKNSLIIYGEGIYNPTVLIKLKNSKTPSFSVDYWDKNKIILKFKHSALTQDEVFGAKVIILSNSDKVVVTGNFALERTLLHLE